MQQSIDISHPAGPQQQTCHSGMRQLMNGAGRKTPDHYIDPARHTMQAVSAILHIDIVPSVLWCCWLGSRKGIQPVKTEWWVAGAVICLEQGADLHMAQLMPLPLTVSCFSKIQIVFTFLVPAHLGSPGQRAVRRVYYVVQYVFRRCINLRWQTSKLLSEWCGCQWKLEMSETRWS